MENVGKNTDVAMFTNNNTSATKIEKLVQRLVYVEDFNSTDIKAVPEIMESHKYSDLEIHELRGWLYDIVLEKQFDHYWECDASAIKYLREFLITEEDINFNWDSIEMSADNSVLMVVNKNNELIFGYDWYSILTDQGYADNERIQEVCSTVGVYQIDCQDMNDMAAIAKYLYKKQKKFLKKNKFHKIKGKKYANSTYRPYFPL